MVQATIIGGVSLRAARLGCRGRSPDGEAGLEGQVLLEGSHGPGFGSLAERARRLLAIFGHLPSPFGAPGEGWLSNPCVLRPVRVSRRWSVEIDPVGDPHRRDFVGT